MTIQFSRQGMAARPARALRPDRAWCAGLFELKTILASSAYGRGSEILDDEQLASLGLTPEDILVLSH